MKRLGWVVLGLIVGCAPDQFATDAGDAQDDVPILGDAGDATVPAVYSDIASATKWSSFDTKTINANVGGYSGATFDGKYVYFAPASAPIAVRHEASKALGDSSSWETIDLTTAGGSYGYAGAAFDGRYVYFAPDANGNLFGAVIRYDTEAPFGQPGSWSTFDLTTLKPSAIGFIGVVFDGKYLYFIPNKNNLTNAVFVRYDTTASFSSPGSWTVVDVSAFDPAASGFAGGVFDGRYVYAAPQDSTEVARYDTQASFTSNGSWTFFDPSTIDSNAKGFFGGILDGRYVYFVPLNKTGTLVRYDTKAPFNVPSSWTTFATTSVDPTAQLAISGGFDGRYVYLDPLDHVAPDGGAGASTVMLRYDDTATLASPASWSKFDLLTLTPPTGSISCAVFDGSHMYFAGILTPVIARFDAKTPAGMPDLPAFHGSFF